MDKEYLIALGFLSYVKKTIEGKVKIGKTEHEAGTWYNVEGLENIVDEDLVKLLTNLFKEIKNKEY